MRVVILAAGAASRLGGLAPDGCKPLVPVLGRPAIEWQLDSLPDDVTAVTVVVRNRHARHLRHYDIDIQIDDSLGGPVSALLHAPLDRPTLVLFADTLFDALPDRRDCAWNGVGLARGGRDWEFRSHLGHFQRRHVNAQRVQAVCVGAYYFPDPHRLLDVARDYHRHMYVVLNDYGVTRDEIVPGWLDIGDPEAHAHAEQQMVAL